MEKLDNVDYGEDSVSVVMSSRWLELAFLLSNSMQKIPFGGKGNNQLKSVDVAYVGRSMFQLRQLLFHITASLPQNTKT